MHHLKITVRQDLDHDSGLNSLLEYKQRKLQATQSEEKADQGNSQTAFGKPSEGDVAAFAIQHIHPHDSGKRAERS